MKCFVFEPGEIERQVRTTGELRLRIDGTDFHFNLKPKQPAGAQLPGGGDGPRRGEADAASAAGAYLQGDTGGPGRHARSIQPHRPWD